MYSTLAALGLAGTGLLAQVVSAVEPAVRDGGSTFAPYIQGGGSAAAVAGLVYVARLIAKGELVPRAVKDTENELNANVMVQAQREANAMRIAEEANEARLAEGKRHDQSLVLMTQVRQSLEDVSREMEYWREMRDRGTRRSDGPAPEDRGGR